MVIFVSITLFICVGGDIYYDYNFRSVSTHGPRRGEPSTITSLRPVGGGAKGGDREQQVGVRVQFSFYNTQCHWVGTSKWWNIREEWMTENNNACTYYTHIFRGF